MVIAEIIAVTAVVLNVALAVYVGIEIGKEYRNEKRTQEEWANYTKGREHIDVMSRYEHFLEYYKNKYHREPYIPDEMRSEIANRGGHIGE